MEICSIDNCDKKGVHRYKDGKICPMHYQRWKRGKDLSAPKHGLMRKGSCTTPGCGYPVKARQLCRTCYGYFERGEEPKIFRRRGTYAKERKIDSKGYAKWYDPTSPHASPSGWVFEHRHVMAEWLGRKLYPGENIHHRNGVRSDNRVENLQLWVSFQPAGQRPSDLVEWAKEILRRYDE